MTAPSQRQHFDLVHDFVHRIGTECRSVSEVMIVLESMLTGCMLVGSELHRLEPRRAADLAELALQHAVERFVAAEIDMRRHHRRSAR